MREIKFRAWIPDAKQMRDVISIEFDEPDDVYSRVPQVIVWNHASTRAAKIKGHVATYLKKDLVLMQYTGLKDKNGKEIYEGDIVKATSTGGQMGIVEWRDGEFIIDFNRINGNMIYEIGFRATQDEIIGNIYENPELINRKDGE